MKLDDLDTSQRFEARLISSEPITDRAATEEVRALELEVELAGRPLALEPGQSLGVLAPADPAFGQKEHLRLYTVADLPEPLPHGRLRVHVCVRRCSYIDPYSGERYQGVASNYLCDLRPGDRLTVCGPYGSIFPLPEDPQTDLVLIGAGTGIAPFRAYLKNLYTHCPDFRGGVWLLHGGRTGLEMLYRNELRDDLSQYLDRPTFEAIEAVSRRPDWSEEIDWGGAIEPRGERLWALLQQPQTHVYVAGLEAIRDNLDQVLSRLAGSAERWQRRKAELVAGGRWRELLY
jgi:ferredoxin--NADP+ reductase